MLVKAIGMISSRSCATRRPSAAICCRKSGASICAAYSCWRNGGYLCYGAIGDNSYYHSAMGGRLCYAVYPGDAATALIPFDASVTLATPSGPKTLSVEQLVPGDLLVDGRIQSHVVASNEILTEVVIPPPRPNVRTSFEKLRPRGVWDFAMASLGLSLEVQNGIVADARVVFGGIAGRPWRENTVEALLKGKTLGPDLLTEITQEALANVADHQDKAMKIDNGKGLLASGLAQLSTPA